MADGRKHFQGPHKNTVFPVAYLIAREHLDLKTNLPLPRNAQEATMFPVAYLIESENNSYHPSHANSDRRQVDRESYSSPFAFDRFPMVTDEPLFRTGGVRGAIK